MSVTALASMRLPSTLAHFTSLKRQLDGMTFRA